MANKLYEETAIQNIASAIREKNGGTNTYKVSEMATAIRGISGLDSEVIEFTQMNDKVTAYLADADAQYTDSNGTSVSVITNHATSTGDKDRPLGLSITTQNGTRYLQNETSGDGGKLTNLIGSKSIIYNAIPNQISQYLVKDSNGNLLDNGRIKPTGKVRMIKFYGYPRNCRDLGGWACDGGTVEYGKLYRSSAIGDVDSVCTSIVRELGIHHEIDLREAEELTEDSFASIVHYHHLPLALYFNDVIDSTKGDYESIKSIIRTIFNAVTKNEAVLYHCAIGRDRTGTVSALLLSILGVAIKDIDKDFELSSFSALNTPANRTSTEYRSLINAIQSIHGTTLMAGAVKWCLKAGFSIDEINAFRSAMVNGTPTVLKAEDYATVYTITQNLSNCTSSVSQSSIVEGDTLTVTITPNTNYEMSSLTVTMGGTDITSSVVSGNAITIAEVTGNVVITASATEMVAYTNVIKTVGTEDGVRIRGTGATQTGYDGFASGQFEAVKLDVVRVYMPNGSVSKIPSTGNAVAIYDSSKALIHTFATTTTANFLKITDNGYSFRVANADAKYVRVAGAPKGGYTDWVVTVNETIPQAPELD